MKKVLFPLVIVCALCASCVDSDLPNVNGMWQLKTIEAADGSSHPVDTIFYSFQYQRIFSQTVLNANPHNPNNPTVCIYGYTDFSVKDKLTLSLNHGDDVSNLLIWDVEQGEKTVTIDIVRHNSKKLILRRNGSTYNFIKF
jgi:hypothetical protein